MFISPCVSMCLVLTLLNVASKQNSEYHDYNECSFNKTINRVLRGVINNQPTDFSEPLPSKNEAIENTNEPSFAEVIANRTLKVAVTFTPMESIFKAQLSNGSMVNIYGSSNVAYGYLLDLQDIFQFRIKVVPSVGWITEGVNGALTGVGAQVHYGQADIGLDISKPVIYRARHLTFLHAIKQDRVAIMFRQPQVQIYRNILARPFKDGLWKRVLQSFFAIFLSTVVIARRKDIQNILLPITGALLGRSVYMAGILNFSSRSSRSLHIVVFVTSLFGLTMYSIYSAFIVGSLRRYVSPVKSFQDLIDFEYELIAQRSLPDFTNVFLSDPREGRKYARIARKNFINEKNSLHRLFYPVIENHTTTVESESHEESVAVGVAWFVLKSDFYYLALENNYTTRQICDISKLEPTSRPEHPRLLSMFIAKTVKNSSTSINGMKEHFNRRILDIMARGLGHRHITRYESEFQPNCLRRRRVQIMQIRYYDVYFAYLVLLCGAGIALIVMVVMECLIPNWWQQNRHQIAKENSRVVFVRRGTNEMENQRQQYVGAAILW